MSRKPPISPDLIPASFAAFDTSVSIDVTSWPVTRESTRNLRVTLSSGLPVRPRRVLTSATTWPMDSMSLPELAATLRKDRSSPSSLFPVAPVPARTRFRPFSTVSAEYTLAAAKPRIGSVSRFDIVAPAAAVRLPILVMAVDAESRPAVMPRPASVACLFMRAMSRMAFFAPAPL